MIVHDLLQSLPLKIPGHATVWYYFCISFSFRLKRTKNANSAGTCYFIKYNYKSACIGNNYYMYLWLKCIIFRVVSIVKINIHRKIVYVDGFQRFRSRGPPDDLLSRTTDRFGFNFSKKSKSFAILIRVIR